MVNEDSAALATKIADAICTPACADSGEDGDGDDSCDDFDV